MRGFRRACRRVLGVFRRRLRPVIIHAAILLFCHQLAKCVLALDGLLGLAKDFRPSCMEKAARASDLPDGLGRCAR